MKRAPKTNGREPDGRRPAVVRAVTRLEYEALENWVDSIMQVVVDLRAALINEIEVDTAGLSDAARSINKDAVHINALCLKIEKEYTDGYPPF